MNNPSLKAFLQQQAEQMAPASEIHLWPAIRVRLSARHAVLPDSNGGSKMKTSQRAFTIAGSIILAIILAVALVAVTPQGRALAEQFMALFFQTAPDVRPFDPTGASPAITPAASIQEVEDLAQWHVFTPTWLPEGYGFTRTEYRPERGNVLQSYSYKHAIGMRAAYFYLGQQKTPFTTQWPVGESAKIETVQIGNTNGEYVVGVWGGAEDHLEWEDNPGFQTLRWRANGYYFEIEFSIWGFEPSEYANNPYYLSKEQLIAIAGSLK